MVKCVGLIVSNPSTVGVDKVEIQVNYVYSDRSANTSGGSALADCNLDSTADQFNAAIIAAIVAAVLANMSIGVQLDTNEVRLLNPFVFS
jgi:hypothetical protein